MLLSWLQAQDSEIREGLYRTRLLRTWHADVSRSGSQCTANAVTGEHFLLNQGSLLFFQKPCSSAVTSPSSGSENSSWS